MSAAPKLFKVSSTKGKLSVLVKGETIEEVVRAAVLKLKKPEAPYKLTLATGEEIDDDEVLCVIGGTNQTNIPELLLLGENESFTGPDNPADHSSGNVSSPTQPQQSDRAVPGPKVVLIPYEKFPGQIRKAIEKKTRPLASDRRELVRVIADHMMFTLKDRTRSMAAKIAALLVERHPACFEDKIAANGVAGGSEGLMIQIYNRLGEIADKKKKPVRAHEEIDDPSVPVKTLDIYGCKEWLPEDSPDISKEELTVEIEDLKKHFEDARDVTSDIRARMKKLFYFQRMDIVADQMPIDAFMERWPYLRETLCCLDHVERVVGAPLQDKWLRNVAATRAKFYAFLEGQISSNRKKLQSVQPNKWIELKKLYVNSKDAAKSLQNDKPLHLGMVASLPPYFNEDTKSLYRIMEVSSRVAEVEGALGQQSSPVVAILGRSLFDHSAEAMLVVEGRVVGRPKVQDAFLHLMCIYYMFGLAYPDAVCTTLEFLQRAFLEISPPKQPIATKEGKRRYRKTTFSRKVVTLLEKIEEQSWLFRHENPDEDLVAEGEEDVGAE